MKNIFLRINQIQNAPNMPYYRDSRILKVVISPSEQYQYAELSGLETLSTDKCFNFHYNEKNSVLKLILAETKPNNFDIAYSLISLDQIQENLLVKETQIMQTTVSGIMNPLITFDLQISSGHSELSNNSPQNLYPTLKDIGSSDSSQSPFIPDGLDFTAITKNSENFQTNMNDKFFEQNNEYSSCSSDYDNEEEDMIVNARVYFNDDANKLLKSIKVHNGLKVSKLQQQTKESANKYQIDSSNKRPILNMNEESSSAQNNKNNSTPFIPPEENDAPFLLPKSS